MTLNEILIRQQFVNKIVLKNNENELPKELKVKVMSMRIALNKIRAQYDKDSQEAIEGLKPEGFNDLYMKEVKTDEESKKLDEWIAKLTEEHNAFLIEKGKEEVEFNKTFTEEEFADLVDTNSNTVDINGNQLSAEDFLEILYTLFVN